MTDDGQVTIEGRRLPWAVLQFIEGEAPRALLVEGATRAPAIDPRVTFE